MSCKSRDMIRLHFSYLWAFFSEMSNKFEETFCRLEHIYIDERIWRYKYIYGIENDFGKQFCTASNFHTIHLEVKELIYKSSKKPTTCS